MKRLPVGVILAFFSTIVPVAGESVTVAVAANMQFAAGEICAAFYRETGIETTMIVGSSGKLSSQIANGSPVDVFLSADLRYPRELVERGAAVGPPLVYALGSIVIWTFRGDLTVDEGLDVLLSDRVSRIAVANPRFAPYGRAAIQAMEASGLFKKVEAKLVYGESIAQVSSYLLVGAVDVAISSEAIVRAPRQEAPGLDTRQSRWGRIDPRLYDPIEQGAVAIVRNGSVRPAAARFLAFLKGADARAILSRYGYELPGRQPPGEGR